MSELLRKLFHKKKPNRDDSNTVKVLVSLSSPPDQSCLAELTEIGLEVESIAGNKLIGEITANQLSDLKKFPKVTEVERSETLGPTNDKDI